MFLVHILQHELLRRVQLLLVPSDYQHSIGKDRFAVFVTRVCDHPLKNEDELAKMWCRAIKTGDFMERRYCVTIMMMRAGTELELSHHPVSGIMNLYVNEMRNYYSFQI